MSVADLTLAVYALLTVTVVFGAGRLWGPGSRLDGHRRSLGTLFAGSEVLLLAYYMVWTDDRIHRAAYMMMNAAVVGVVLSAAALVVYATRRYRRGWFVTVPAVVLGLTAAAYTVVARDLFWPPFAVLNLALVLGAAAATVPRWRIPGYRPLRDAEFLPWTALAALGLWGTVETVSMVGLVPGTAWFGRPALFHFFVSGAAVLWLVSSSVPEPSPASAEDTVPWHLFNPPLSPREADLVAGLRRRLTNKELAAGAGVSESTVKKHLVSVFRKAGVSTRQELVERLDGTPH